MKRSGSSTETATRARALLCVAALAISALAGFLPHGHEAAGPAAAPADHRSHAPRADYCLETGAAHAPEAFCAICFFQRVASHGRLSVAPQLGPDVTVDRVDLARSAHRDRRVLDARDSRAPPAA